MRGVFEKIFSDENLISEFSKKETEEELYEFCKSIDERCTEEDFDEFIFQALEEFYIKSESQKLDLNDLENVAGGMNLNNLVKKGIASTLATLSMVSGMSAMNHSFAANEGSKASVSQSQSESRENSKFKKIKNFLKNHKLGVGIGITLGVIVLGGTVYGIYKYKSNKNPKIPAAGAPKKEETTASVAGAPKKDETIAPVAGTTKKDELKVPAAGTTKKDEAKAPVVGAPKKDGVTAPVAGTQKKDELKAPAPGIETKENTRHKAERKTEIIARADMFEKITGVTEKEFRANPELVRKCIVREPNGEFSIVNSKTGERFKAGKFEEYSIGDLDRIIAGMPQKSDAKGKLSVISLSEKTDKPEVRKKVDVADMQIDPGNKGALFGVASNFHALETIFAEDSTSDKKISEYIDDKTQGPFASMSAMPGLILRTYGHYYDEKTSPTTWKQTDEKQVNLLSGLGVKTQNGYAVTPPAELHEKLSAPDAKKKFRIGYHKDINATGGYSFSDEKQECVIDSDQVIDQVFCAALNLDGREDGDYRYGYYNSTDQNKESAKKILEWTFEAILKADYAQGKKKVVLPLIGAGVFNNDPSWIAEALEKQKDFVKRTGMEVVVNLYSQAASKKPSSQSACEKFREIADSYLLVDKDGNVTEQKR